MKPFEATQKKCENKNLIYFLFKCNFLNCTGREGLRSLSAFQDVQRLTFQ